MSKNFSVHICPILEDNYSYFIVDHSTKQVAVVDPAEPSKVVTYFSKLNKDHNNELRLSQVLTTHKHWDHAGGNKEMKKQFPDIEVVGSKYEEIDAITKKVSEADSFKIGQTDVRVLFTPCHTRGHVQYFVEDKSNNEFALFSGDTLFIAGCGKFFEGDASQMWSNFQQLKKLDPSTKLYCGHEYTLSNLKFAKSVDPNNEALLKKEREAKELRDQGKPTVPTTMGDEFQYNPFLRADDPEIQKNHGTVGDPVKTLHSLREKKNNFK
jgi:hydroxyacylglutathione hydrolase